MTEITWEIQTHSMLLFKKNTKKKENAKLITNTLNNVKINIGIPLPKPCMALPLIILIATKGYPKTKYLKYWEDIFWIFILSLKTETILSEKIKNKKPIIIPINIVDRIA